MRGTRQAAFILLVLALMAVGPLPRLAPAHRAEAAGCGILDFVPASGSPFGVGDFPSALISVDVDDDGNVDLVAVNRTTGSPAGSVTVLLGDGAGDFTATSGSPIAVGEQPDSVAAGDFDEDGNLDLVTGNVTSDNVTLLLGDGAGGFTEATNSPFSNSGSFPNSIQAGDIDADGNLDVVVGNTGGINAVTVMFGDGAGDFPSATSLASLTDPLSLVVADLDADSQLDLAVANSGPGTVSVRLRDNLGGFFTAANSPFSVGAHPISIVAADLDGDGDLDLVTADSSDDQVTVLLGDGLGDFAAAANSPFTTGDSPISVAAGDLDGDGDIDLVTANLTVDTLTVLLNDGNADFTEASGSPFGLGAPGSPAPRSPALADYDEDGLLDIAVANGATDNVSVLLNDCTADGTPPTLTSQLSGTAGLNGWYTSNVTVSFECTDAESGVAVDTVPDVLVTTEGANQQITSTGVCQDNAGNTADAATVSVSIDKTGPTLTPQISGTAGTNGWYTSAVTLGFDCADGVSGVGTDTVPDVVLTGEGANQQVTSTGVCQDVAGHTAGAAQTSVSIDKTGPTATLTIISGTPGDNGWYVSSVTVETTGADSVSGPVTCTAEQTQATDTASRVFTGSCTNQAGLSTDAAPLAVQVDQTPPHIGMTIEPWPLEFGDTPTATPDATDATSGVASANCTVLASPIGGSVAISCTARDVAGNTASTRVAFELRPDEPPPVIGGEEGEPPPASGGGGTPPPQQGPNVEPNGGILYGSAPRCGGDGFGTFVFGGGSLAELLAVTCCGTSAVFFFNKPDGAFAVWVSASTVGAVNAEFLGIFAGTPAVPRGTIFTARCV